MRLTLRTLLAYLDSLLDPKDADELGKKIEESEYATSLVHRIRDTMRRLRLGAPSLTDRGPGLDPNTVAEYLDNTLTSERVSDFEKVCLDSDIHLAEVASCHQILTLVLGEPAEVEPASREQMYQLIQAPAPASPPARSVEKPPALPGAAPAPQIDLGEPDLAGRKARLKPTVPEYLREPRRKPAWVSIAAAAVLVVCVTLIVLKSLGQFEPKTPLGDLLVSLGLVEAPAEPEVAAVSEGEKRGPTAPPLAAKPAGETVKPPAADAGKAPEKLPAVEPPKGPSDQTTQQPVKPAAAGPGKPPEAAKPVPPLPVSPEATPPAVPPTVPGTVPAVPPTPEPPPKSVHKLPPMPGVEETKEKLPEPPVAPLPPAGLAEPMGQSMSGDQVLLGRDAAGNWTRVLANQVLVPQQLLVLPTYRAKVVLTAGVALEILGGTRLELLGTAPPLPPGIDVFYGRVVLRPLAKADSKLRVAFGGRTGTVTFVDSDSQAALDVHRLRLPGTNPETEPPRFTAMLYATTGALLWEESSSRGLTAPGDGQPLRLAPPQRLSFDGQAAPAAAAAKELPKWITAEPIKDLDRRASLVMAQALSGEKPGKAARVGLLELATSRPQREVRWLALRSLGYIGQFDDMVNALDDPAHKLDWQDYYVEELRAAVSRDPETAAAVRLALERRYPQQAADLYRMLWGYSDKDLQGGDDAKLVRGLDDDSLAVRRLSFWNLREIMGRGLYYEPEQIAAKRRAAVQAWRQRLEKKDIRWKAPEDRPAPPERATRRPPEPSPPPAPQEPLPPG